MLKIITKCHQLDFGQLMNVYRDSILDDGMLHYPWLDDGQKIQEAEQDYYAFLREFFKFPGAFLAVWEIDGVYCASLRIEPYADGFLLEGVETAPDKRRRGFAKSLIENVVKHLSDKDAGKLYSHIDNMNLASIKLHEACHFIKQNNHAVFADGSVDHHTFTYVREIKNKVQSR